MTGKIGLSYMSISAQLFLMEEKKLVKLLSSVCISKTMRKFRGKVMKSHAILGLCGKWERK